MLTVALRSPVLSMVILLFTIYHGNAQLLKRDPVPLRPSTNLLSDLKTTWNGLFGFPDATHLLARNADNVTGSSSGNLICILGRPDLTDPHSVTNGVQGSPNGTNDGVTKSGSPTTKSGHSPSPSPSQLPPSIWKLFKSHEGDSFFDEWDFNVGADPTHGDVDFLDGDTARALNLSYINDNGNAIMAVDTTPKISGNRRSVRITTNYQYTGGLLVLDAVHAPTGCATWPAFWSNGPDWPNHGEIDIMEGVNDVSVNQASVHTAPGCHISDSQSTNNATGTLVGGSDCASAESNNGGCGQQATSLQNTYGVNFNNNGGGVYAMVWDEAGPAVYFFPRDSIPDDITSLAPQPDSWGVPFARWPSTNCNSFEFFNMHSVIFDITLCGDWAGNVWSQSGPPGQEQSCAQRTGVASCTDFVQNNGAAFQQAFWEVRSVRLYQKDV